MWTAAVIAGGVARRLGGCDKSALLVGDRRIIDRQLAVVGKIADQVVIVANDRERYEQFGLPIFADEIAGAGALGGVYTAVRRSQTERVVVLAADMPFVTSRFLRHLVAVGCEADVAVPRPHGRYEPLCATYSRACEGPMLERIEAGSLRLIDFITAADGLTKRELGAEELAAFDPAGTLFFNINTSDDYARAKELMLQATQSVAMPRAGEE